MARAMAMTNLRVVIPQLLRKVPARRFSNSGLDWTTHLQGMEGRLMELFDKSYNRLNEDLETTYQQLVTKFERKLKEERAFHQASAEADVKRWGITYIDVAGDVLYYILSRQPWEQKDTSIFQEMEGESVMCDIAKELKRDVGNTCETFDRVLNAGYLMGHFESLKELEPRVDEVLKLVTKYQSLVTINDDQLFVIMNFEVLKKFRARVTEARKTLKEKIEAQLNFKISLSSKSNLF